MLGEAGQVVVGDVERENPPWPPPLTAATPPSLAAPQQRLQLGRGESGPGQAQADTVEPSTGQQGGSNRGQADLTEAQVAQLWSGTLYFSIIVQPPVAS